MDTTIITTMPDRYERILESYSSILEKTNGQLSLWTNPLSLAVGILSLMVAVMAIFVAYYFWRNSREQKELFSKLIESSKNSLDEQWRAIMEQKKLEIDKKISSLESEQNTALVEKKKELQKMIDNYKQEKEVLSATSLPRRGVSYVPYNLSISNALSALNLSAYKNIICSNCGKSFEYYDDAGANIFSVSAITPGSRKLVHCSHCGAKNIVT
jgi:hypothetical protein